MWRRRVRRDSAQHEGCTIKNWQVTQQSENSYVVMPEYYMKPPGRVKHLKTKATRSRKAAPAYRG